VSIWFGVFVRDSSEELRRTLTDGGADGSRDVSGLGGGGG